MPDSLGALVIKVAQLCNLNCSYCFVYNHEDQRWRQLPKFMSDEVFERLLVVAREYCERRGSSHRMNLIFHGGEPTLVGPERFDYYCTRAREVMRDRLRGLAIQTNGTLLDDRWVEVFRRHRVHAGVSMDGPRTIHDAVRVTHAGGGSYDETVRGLQLLQRAGLNPGIISVVNPGHSGAESYRHFRSLGLTFINYLFPHASHDTKERLYGRFGPTPVADYLIPIFDLWYDEDDPTVKIPLFWGLVRRMMGGPGWKDDFGNPLMHYLVVESDGGIEALDAMKVCGEGITCSGLNVLQHGFDDLEKGLPLVHQAVHVGFPLPTGCKACPEREVCGGGYLPERYSRARGFDNPSIWCADILKLLAHVRTRTELPILSPEQMNHEVREGHEIAAVQS